MQQRGLHQTVRGWALPQIPGDISLCHLVLSCERPLQNKEMRSVNLIVKRSPQPRHCLGKNPEGRACRLFSSACELLYSVPGRSLKAGTLGAAE